MLELKDISLKRGETKILNKLSATFEDGRIYAVLGNNGVGKSTLSYILMGLENYKDYEGSIFLDSQSLKEKKINERAKLGITLAWQEPARFDGITVREYFTLGGRTKLTTEEMVEMLKKVGLSDKYLNRTVDSSLSGGERKRIELASVMFIKPRVVILDEPDSGIDLMSTDMIGDVMSTLKSENTTVIVITHREEIAKMADEAYLICGGRMLASGEVDEIVQFYRKLCDKCHHVNEPEGGEINDRVKL